MSDMPAQDAHYLRSIRDALIERVAERMNVEMRDILARSDVTARAKRVEVHEAATRHHYMISLCFDDWKRATMWLKCRSMVKHAILEERDLTGLTTETAEHIRAMRSDAAKEANQAPEPTAGLRPAVAHLERWAKNAPLA